MRLKEVTVMPVRQVLEKYLVEVRDDLLRLSSMADQAIANSLKALVERDGDLAAQVSVNDATLNRLRFTIEENCYRLLATQQPNATDLRIVVGTVSIATDLERIGDHAAGVARLALRMIDSPPIKPLVDIPQMAEIDRLMIKNAVNAFLKRDQILAEHVIEQDRAVDQLHAHVYSDLVAIMTRDASTIERATFLLWVSHNLERIGDRATNICERAIYVATGQLTEHRGHP
jgi:phosphate transport system protein